MRALFSLLPVLLFSELVANSVAYSASSEEIGFLQNEQLLREQQRELRLLERERLFRELERSLYTIEVPLPEVEPEKKLTPDICFDIEQIDFEGANNLLEHEQQTLKQPWLGSCMNLSDIDMLRASIDRHYIEQGWIMARAYLVPDQNIKLGKIVYRIHEGVLDDIRLNFNDVESRAAIATAFPSMIDEVIYIRDIEQGLDQINRLASNVATMTIEPVEGEVGKSRMLVSSIAKNPYRLTLGVDNQGSHATGEKRSRLIAEADNLLSLNDSIYVSVSDYVGDNPSAEDNSAFSVNLSVPYGYWTYSLTMNRSEYLSTNTSDTGLFRTRGETDSNKLTASRIVHRDKNSKTTASVALDLKDTRTFLEDVPLSTSTRKLSVVDLQLQHFSRTDSAVWSVQAGYSRGLAVAGALLDAPLTGDATPKAQFEKISWYASYSMPFSVSDIALRYSGALSGQASRDALFGSEQIAIGGISSVRGFRDSPAAGDSGSYIRNDISWSPAFEQALLRGMSFSAGMDVGYVRVRDNNINNTGATHATLAGVALGVQQSRRFQFDQQLGWSLSMATALSNPDYIAEESSVLLFSLNWKFW